MLLNAGREFQRLDVLAETFKVRFAQSVEGLNEAEGFLVQLAETFDLPNVEVLHHLVGFGEVLLELLEFARLRADAPSALPLTANPARCGSNADAIVDELRRVARCISEEAADLLGGGLFAL